MNTSHLMKCQNCKYTRAWHNSPVTAETKAIMHARRKSHTVKIITTDLDALTTSEVEFTSEREQQLPLDPPF